MNWGRKGRFTGVDVNGRGTQTKLIDCMLSFSFISRPIFAMKPMHEIKNKTIKSIQFQLLNFFRSVGRSGRCVSSACSTYLILSQHRFLVLVSLLFSKRSFYELWRIETWSMQPIELLAALNWIFIFLPWLHSVDRSDVTLVNFHLMYFPAGHIDRFDLRCT